MVATCGSDKKIIVHRMTTKEFLSDVLFEEPQVTRMYTFDPTIGDPASQRQISQRNKEDTSCCEVLRLKWNISSTLS